MTIQNERTGLSAEKLNQMTILDAALSLAEADLPFEVRLLPLCPPDHKGVIDKHRDTCQRPGKVPRVSNWLLKATNDLGRINEWFGKWPTSNIGMVTGSHVGIIAIDYDGQYGFQKLKHLFGDSVPVTPQFTTPNGGRLLFKVPKGLTLRKYTDSSPEGGHEELSILVDGQMTVIPPSVNMSGVKYVWTPGRGLGDVPLADAPEVLLKLVSPVHGAGSLFVDNDSWEEEGDPEAPLSSAVLPKETAPLTGRGQHPTTSNGVLDKLADDCVKLAEIFAEQRGVGSNNDTWHKTTSMLVQAGHVEAARFFSELSDKHNDYSAKRIKQMELDRVQGTYGPTRCITFGCDKAQIKRCFGNVRTNQNGEITNTPATFVSVKNAKQDADSVTKVTEKANLLPKMYSIDNRNLSVVHRDKDDKLKLAPQGNFFAWINKDILKDDGAERLRLYELEGVILATGKALTPILVSATEFESMKWLTQWGPEPNIMPGNKVRDTVRHAIQSTARGATHERIFAHLGWVKLDGKWVYLHAGGAVGAESVKVTLDPRLKNYALPTPSCDAKSAMEYSLKLLNVAPHRITLVLWALVYLAPLCEWLRWLNIEPKFLVWLHGYTGTRKTTLAKLFLCHFGNLLQHPPANFKDTANSLEKRSFDTKDSLLLIDDYHPNSTLQEAKKMAQLAEQVLRGYGDRVARGRMTQDTSLRPDYLPRGMAIVTAEDVITGGSSVARVFPVELLPADVDLNKLTEAQKNATKLAETMTGFLTWVSESMNRGVDNKLTTVFRERERLTAGMNVHGRLTESAAWLYLGLCFGLDYAHYVGAIETEQKEKLLVEAWDLFISIACEQGSEVTEVKPTTKFISIVSELLANRTIFTKKLGSGPYGDVPNDKGTHVGWHDNEYYYFLPEVLYNAVVKFLGAQGDHFPITAQTLWKQLAEEKFTIPDVSNEKGKERRHNTRKKSIDGNNSRKLWVRSEVLTERALQQPRSRPRHQPTHSGSISELFAPENGDGTPDL